MDFALLGHWFVPDSCYLRNLIKSYMHGVTEELILSSHLKKSTRFFKKDLSLLLCVNLIYDF